MKGGKQVKTYLLSIAIALAASVYPLYMGVTVLIRMAKDGAIPLEEYPKYIIPYTPIALSVLCGVLLIPLMQKLAGKEDVFFGTGVSLAVFFVTERIMETKVLVLATGLVTLESWQMSLCYVPPDLFETRKWEAVDILLGGYSPAFKIHFYLISVVIILALLNCFYGFARMSRSGDLSRKKALIIQVVTAVVFLGMCIWACFTAFYRRGELTVSALSAILMAVFFALLGITVGVFAASFTLGKKKPLSHLLPTVTAVSVTVLMYIGEMILLHGNLYRFGKGFFFEGLGALVLAPADILVIIASGVITLLICRGLNKAPRPSQTAAGQ